MRFTALIHYNQLVIRCFFCPQFSTAKDLLIVTVFLGQSILGKYIMFIFYNHPKIFFLFKLEIYINYQKLVLYF